MIKRFPTTIKLANIGAGATLPVGHDLAVAEFDDPVGMFGHLHVVGYQDNGMAVFVQVTEDGHHRLAARRIEGAGRFVGKNNAAAVHQGTADGNPLLLPARKLAGAMRQPVGHAETGQEIDGPCSPGMLVKPGVERQDRRQRAARFPCHQCSMSHGLADQDSR